MATKDQNKNYSDHNATLHAMTARREIFVVADATRAIKFRRWDTDPASTNRSKSSLQMKINGLRITIFVLQQTTCRINADLTSRETGLRVRKDPRNVDCNKSVP